MGRADQVKAAFLGLLAKEHVLLIGPPGTAKSINEAIFCRIAIRIFREVDDQIYDS